MVRERLKSMSFDGDIIITDPCYITKDRDTTDEPKWEDYMRPAIESQAKNGRKIVFFLGGGRNM